jgi:prophage regulatory protein
MVLTMTKHVGAAEIGVMLGGVSRQRVYQIVSRPDFPKAVEELRMGKIWLTTEVEAWIRKHRPNVAGTSE